MRDFYAAPSTGPLDQADGLRRLFAGSTAPRQRVLALAANPHVAFSSLVLDRVAAVLARQGRKVLVVDAATGAPAANELAGVDLAVCIEHLSPQVAYLPARGLPMSYVDTRGSAGAFIDTLFEAAPWADALVLHADPHELARLLMRRQVRPLLLGADHPESIKHAYATLKLLAQRCGLMTFDLLLAAAPQSPRAEGIANSLARCADSFLGALLHAWARVDPAAEAADVPDAALTRLLAGQLTLGNDALNTHSPVSQHEHAAPSRGLPMPDSILNRPHFR